MRMSCSATTSPGSAARGMKPHISSRRTRTMRSALSASGSAGSRPLTLRAFTAPTPPPRGRRGAPGAARGAATRALGRLAALGPLELGGEDLVARGLALALAFEQPLDARALGGRH